MNRFQQIEHTFLFEHINSRWCNSRATDELKWSIRTCQQHVNAKQSKKIELWHSTNNLLQNEQIFFTHSLSFVLFYKIRFHMSWLYWFSFVYSCYYDHNIARWKNLIQLIYTSLLRAAAAVVADWLFIRDRDRERLRRVSCLEQKHARLN